MTTSRLVPVVTALLLAAAPPVLLRPIRAAAPPESVSSADPRSPEDERKAFKLPPGFVAELIAAEPEIHKPLNIAFDPAGRLWLTETIEYPFPAPEGRKPRDGVKILSDFGPDGRARKIETFADGLNIPIGLLPLPSGREALVHSIPNVWRLSDTDGDGKADRKEPLYESFGFRDTHGMTNAFSWGFDGWVYACHGFSNESRVQGADRQAIVMQSGNTYRMKPDGSHAEYYTHGQVNPFGLSFDPLGNLYSSDCHTKPVYQLLRGAWYPSFGKPDDGLGFAPEMCAHDHGSTAISGIVYYAADQFPREYRDTIFIGNVVTNRINHDRIEWHGSSPKAVETPDFLASDDPWFRPVDIKLGPDGALYVADFYNRIIGHYEVPLTHPGRDRERGRVWRIVYRGKDGAKAESPRADFRKATTTELLADLGHPNLSVRTFAANELAGRDEPTLGPNLELAVATDNNPDRRLHALWLLQRRGKLDPQVLARALNDPTRAVRVHAFGVLGEQAKLTTAFDAAARVALTDGDPFVRRAAAGAVGRHPATGHVKPLLALWRATPADDTHLIHVARMALRDQLKGDDAWPALSKLDLSERERRDIADVAPGVPTAAAAGYLLDHLRKYAEPPDRRVRYVHHVARYLDPARRPELLAYLRERPATDRAGLVALLKAVQQGTQERGEAVDPELRKFALGAAREMLDPARDEEWRLGIETAAAFRLNEASDRLAELVRNGGGRESRRGEALAALAVIDPAGAVPVIAGVLKDPAAPVGLRDRAATALGQSTQPGALPSALDALATAPAQVQATLAVALAQRRDGAEALLSAVAAGKASARLLQDPRLAGPIGNSGIPNVTDRLKTLLHGLPPADEKTRTVIDRRRSSFASNAGKVDATAGAKVFETHCAACHQVGGKGAKVGPQLDGIGGRGADRLMEDILDPSRNVDQTFRLTTLALNDGRVLSGLLLREEGAVLVLADAQGKEVRVPVSTVEERKVAPLSPMPANFADQIPEADFYRLIAYLIARSPTAAAPK